MVNLRFATYYETHPESSNLSLILGDKNHQNNSNQKNKSNQKKSGTSKSQKKSDEFAYLQKSVEMKIDLALLYLNRSMSHLQYI